MEIVMKKIVPLFAVLLVALSIGSNMARAEGGETGSDAAHTQSYAQGVTP
jgi:hypothetical protein